MLFVTIGYTLSTWMALHKSKTQATAMFVCIDPRNMLLQEFTIADRDGG